MLAPAKSPEIRRPAVELARARTGRSPTSPTIAGIAESCLRRWMTQADAGSGRVEGLTSDEHAELVRLRRETRVQAMQIEILKWASAFFARERPPNMRARGVCELAADGIPSRWRGGC